MCAIWLLLTVHGVVLGLRDVHFHVTLDCYMTTLPFDFVIFNVMLPLTVHGVISGLRHMCL